MERLRKDDGLGLTELMVAMLILMVLLLAMLSLLITALQTVAANGTRATAAEAVQQRIEQARTTAVTGDCSNMTDVVTPAETIEDGRGVEITIAGTITNCSQDSGKEHEQPRLARVTVTATTSQDGFRNPLAQTATDIYVRFEP